MRHKNKYLINYCLSSSFFKQPSKCSLISAPSTNIRINKNANDTNNDNFKSCDDKNTINYAKVAN